MKIDTQREQLIAAAREEDGIRILQTGAIVVLTGEHTGRSPNAKSIVRDHNTDETIDWSNNNAYTIDEWAELFVEARDFEYNNDIIEQALYAGRDESRQLRVRVKTTAAWQALYANNMFVRRRHSKVDTRETWELLCFPELRDKPTVAINITQKKIVITGTRYAGEIKKSIFTVMNYIMPQEDTLPMHCSVNTDHDGTNAAIFFGLSGTGKTTLSASEDRTLIGDDEHGWSSDGLFNFEGGCYAKVINLSQEQEPEIWTAVQQHGSILENVIVSDTGWPLFDRSDITENTRGSYPIEHISNASKSGTCCHPSNIIFLTCDAFGVLPPVSKLSVDEAVQHFLLGYTAKVAGTEAGITEPVMTFSHCFGAPFMPRKPEVYANLLREKVLKHNVNCWLVNTGWSGGAFGTGARMPIAVSREIVQLILSGELVKCNFTEHKYTGLNIPERTSSKLLNDYLLPESSWAVIDFHHPPLDADGMPDPGYNYDQDIYADKASYLMNEWSIRFKLQEKQHES
jgi:phosphoenolpyruvate carboxykinase (ATP)